jgi:hypothetical protein
MGWEVEDIEATVRELRARGVEFETYDLPGLKTVDGIADIEGNYASKGIGERGAWFRDKRRQPSWNRAAGSILTGAGARWCSRERNLAGAP